MVSSTPQVVEVIERGNQGAIAVVDFAEFTSRGTLAELIRRDLPDHTVLRIDAVTAVGTDLTDLHIDELAARCADELAPGRPALVIGYCSAAALALRIAAVLAASGRAPAVALVEPTWLTPDHVRGELAQVRALLHAEGDYDGPLDIESLRAVLLADATRELRSQGLSEDEVEECAELLLPRYEAWFGFLLMTLRDAGGSVGLAYGGPVEVLLGRDSVPSVETSGATSFTVHRLPVGAADLLQSEYTGVAIQAALAGSRA